MDHPSLEEWKQLYQAAIEFRDLAPWRWMWDDAVFGVQDPETEEVGYCCIMGYLGEHLALGLYQGSEGLAGLWQIRQGPSMTDPDEFLALQKCLMASFEDRAMLQTRDLDVIKQLGLKFRGRQAWPLFRSYLPGYPPWHITAQDARVLRRALQESMGVAARFQANEHLLPPAEPLGDYLVRVPKKHRDGWRWEDSLQKPKPFVPADRMPPPLDEARIARLKAALPKRRSALEVDYFVVPSGIKGEDGGRPYFPQVLLAADPKSGMILTSHMARPGDMVADLVPEFLNVVERSGSLPAEILVHRKETLALLRPVAAALGIRLVQVAKLKALDSARREFISFLER